MKRGVTQVRTYGMMVVESLQPKERRYTARRAATVRNVGTEATLWDGTRKDGSVITRGCRLSRVNIGEQSWEAGPKGYIREKCINSEIKSMCLILRALTPPPLSKGSTAHCAIGYPSNLPRLPIRVSLNREST